MMKINTIDDEFFFTQAFKGWFLGGSPSADLERKKNQPHPSPEIDKKYISPF